MTDIATPLFNNSDRPFFSFTVNLPFKKGSHILSWVQVRWGLRWLATQEEYLDACDGALSCIKIIVFFFSIPFLQPCWLSATWHLMVLWSHLNILAISGVLHPSGRLFVIFDFSEWVKSLIWPILPEEKKLPNNYAHLDIGQGYSNTNLKRATKKCSMTQRSMYWGRSGHMQKYCYIQNKMSFSFKTSKYKLK